MNWKAQVAKEALVQISICQAGDEYKSHQQIQEKLHMLDLNTKIPSYVLMEKLRAIAGVDLQAKAAFYKKTKDHFCRTYGLMRKNIKGNVWEY